MLLGNTPIIPGHLSSSVCIVCVLSLLDICPWNTEYYCSSFMLIQPPDCIFVVVWIFVIIFCFFMIYLPWPFLFITHCILPIMSFTNCSELHLFPTNLPRDTLSISLVFSLSIKLPYQWKVTRSVVM